MGDGKDTCAKYPTAEKSSAVGNAAAMRHAIETAIADLQSKLELTHDQRQFIVRYLKAALAAPARNCDKYPNLHEAWVAWQNDCAENMQDQKKFDEWLYAKADKKGGDE